jgi:hypothetical protein
LSVVGAFAFVDFKEGNVAAADFGFFAFGICDPHHDGGFGSLQISSATYSPTTTNKI